MLIFDKITKDILLQLLQDKGYTQEDVFLEYLNYSVDYKEKYTNPFRGDPNPGCRFSDGRKDGTIVFVDWSTNKRYDMVDVVQHKYNVSFGTALDIIANDFKLTTFSLERNEVLRDFKKKEVKKPTYGIKVKRKKYSKQELSFWSIGGLFITPAVLERNKIYSIECFWEFENGKEIRSFTGLRNVFAYHHSGYKYQIYWPSSSFRRFINSSDMLEGDLEFLDYSAHYVIVTKSKKDAFYLRLFGLNTVYITSEGLLNERLIEKLRKSFTRIITYFDNDEAGIKASNNYEDVFGTTPITNEDLQCKDFTELIKTYGKEYVSDYVEYLLTNVFV